MREWLQAKVIRTTTRVVQGGANVMREQHQYQQWQVGRQGRPAGQARRTEQPPRTGSAGAPYNLQENLGPVDHFLQRYVFMSYVGLELGYLLSY